MPIHANALNMYAQTSEKCLPLSPPSPNKQESLVKIDVFSDNKYFLKIPLYSSVGVKK